MTKPTNEQLAHVAMKPGAFGLARIGGLLGKVIAAGQAFAGDGSRWTHAFIVLDNESVIEAEPGGARITPLSRYLSDKVEVVFCDTPIQDYMARRQAQVPSGFAPTGPSEFWDYVERLKRDDVTNIAFGLKGTKYGYLQYVYMGLFALTGREGPLSHWLAKRIASRGSMICSQLVDEVYRRAAIQVFDDGRLPQNVTPGDLAIRYGIA